jgi:hypothetical protein
MRHLILTAFVAFACLDPVPAQANFIPPRSLESQLAEADLVLVGRLGDRTICPVRGRQEPCTEIHADVVLKGTPARIGVSRFLILSSPIMEMDIQRMDLSGTVLIFLRGPPPDTENADLLNLRPQYYSPVQAHRSILRVDDSNNR